MTPAPTQINCVLSTSVLLVGSPTDRDELTIAEINGAPIVRLALDVDRGVYQVIAADGVEVVG